MVVVFVHVYQRINVPTKRDSHTVYMYLQKLLLSKSSKMRDRKTQNHLGDRWNCVEAGEVVKITNMKI